MANERVVEVKILVDIMSVEEVVDTIFVDVLGTREVCFWILFLPHVKDKHWDYTVGAHYLKVMH